MRTHSPTLVCDSEVPGHEHMYVRGHTHSLFVGPRWESFDPRSPPSTPCSPPLPVLTEVPYLLHLTENYRSWSYGELLHYSIDSHESLWTLPGRHILPQTFLPLRHSLPQRDVCRRQPDPVSDTPRIPSGLINFRLVLLKPEEKRSNSRPTHPSPCRDGFRLLWSTCRRVRS